MESLMKAADTAGYVAPGTELSILLPLLLECWDYSHVPQHLAFSGNF
jgi:hypothetical protein